MAFLLDPPKLLVCVVVEADRPSLSKAQKAFNVLVKKIECHRGLLLQWQAADLNCQQKISQDLWPAKLLMDAQTVATVRALDEALDQTGHPQNLTKSDRQVVGEIICELACDLVHASGNAALKAIYNKYRPDSCDAQGAAQATGLKNVMPGVIGLDLGGEGGGDDATLPAQTAKTRAKAAQALARAKAEAAHASQSIRGVYRKLASALHPDRETDPLERGRKTVLMQKVNQAYDKKNLLLLLELQLELEHIDAQSIAALPERRLKHFNKILKEQLEGIEQEILGVEMPLRNQLGLSPHQSFMPQMVVPMLQRDIALVGQRTRQLKAELAIFKIPSQFKIWINLRRKELKRRDKEMEDGDLPLS